MAVEIGWPLAAAAVKIGKKGVHRTVSPETTFDRVEPYLMLAGITRLADLTGLDRLGIPVYSAIAPRSRDVISVYNGKGVRRADARTGAVMEALERYVASRDRLPDAVSSYKELLLDGEAVVDPRTVNIQLTPTYDDTTVLAWIRGFDLISGQTCLVPHSLACYYPFQYPWQYCYKVTNTNGLASGNTLEEAVCHALAEVIERDALTLMEVIDKQILVLSQRNPDYSAAKIPHLDRLKEAKYPGIAIESLSEPALSLANAYLAAGVVPYLRRISCDTAVTTVLCMTGEDIDASFSTTHHGLGTDPDPQVAIIRALTEAAQSRVVDMQALREDLVSSDDKVEKHLIHTQRGHQRAADNWLTRPSCQSVSASDLGGVGNSDIVDDIRFMVERLKAAGLNQAVMVDLSLPELPVKVARVIVPGLEGWTLDHGKVGDRARSAWRSFVGHSD